jgi:hypothetical protein
MTDKRTESTHNPSQRAIQRWDNEGGAIKHPRKAADLAGEVIDRQADRTATSEERKSRKKRLLKGPKEFRDMRRDQSKTRR